MSTIRGYNQHIHLGAFEQDCAAEANLGGEDFGGGLAGQGQGGRRVRHGGRLPRWIEPGVMPGWLIVPFAY